jgi:hypothetical protein
MKKPRTLCLAAIAALAMTLFPQPVQAQDSYVDEFGIFDHVSPGVSLGLTGIGIDVAAPISEYVQIRAGYNFFSNPETVMYDAVGVVNAVTYQDVYNGNMSNSEFYAWENSLTGKEKLSRNRHMVSLGIGWSSKGSFFADLTGRMTSYNNKYLSLYEDYITDASGNVTTYSPEVLSSPKLWDVVLTLGWRF